jgi:hypothetical protein
MPATSTSRNKGAAPESWVRIQVWIPADWKQALGAASHEQGVSMADICRLALRAFLRPRLEP